MEEIQARHANALAPAQPRQVGKDLAFRKPARKGTHQGFAQFLHEGLVIEVPLEVVGAPFVLRLAVHDALAADRNVLKVLTVKERRL